MIFIMKVYLRAPGECWVVDRFVDEWKEANSHLNCENIQDCDVVWIISDWSWNQLPLEVLRTKRVITTIHHLVPSKFGEREFADFAARDAITDAYHVPCQKTAVQVSDLHFRLRPPDAKVPITSQPFWINEVFWERPSGTSKFDVRKRLGLPLEGFFVASMQRDTEGLDLVSPKLEKGPDIFCDAVIALREKYPTLRVLLGGWRRQYVIKRLMAANIPFTYLERPSLSVVKEMYLASDLYVVGSRYEGGPQAIPECASLGVPIISTDVGCAYEMLSRDVIFNPLDPMSITLASCAAQTGYAKSYAQNRASRYFTKPSWPVFERILRGS